MILHLVPRSFQKLYEKGAWKELFLFQRQGGWKPSICGNLERTLLPDTHPARSPGVAPGPPASAFSSVNELYSPPVWRLRDTVCQMEKHLEVGKISRT